MGRSPLMKPPIGTQVSLSSTQPSRLVSATGRQSTISPSSAPEEALGWDADQLADGIGAEAAAVAAGDGGVGLDPGAAFDAPVGGEAADGALGEGDGLAADAGVAEDVERVPDLDDVRIPNGDKGHLNVDRIAVEVGDDPDHGQIKAVVDRGDLGQVGEIGGSIRGPEDGDAQVGVLAVALIDDVGVGEDQAFRRDDAS